MKVCIYGAGAVGGYLGGLLCRAGHDVTLIARGERLAAIRSGGLRCVDADGEFHVRPAATGDPREAGPQDAVLITAKAYSMAEVAGGIGPLLGPDTPVVMVQNGVPWWYFHGVGGPREGHRLESVDPGGRIRAHIDPARAIGGVIYCPCVVVAPGTVRHAGNKQLVLGEPDGRDSSRCRDLARAVESTGFAAPVTDRIRDEVWVKLFGNLSFSQIAVLTGSRLGPLTTEPALVDLARGAMEEALAVAEAHGARIPITVEARLEQYKGSSHHKPSTLQDLEAGKPMEIDAMTGAVVEMARLAGVATPTLDLIDALVRRRAITAGCYPGDPEFRPGAGG